MEERKWEELIRDCLVEILARAGTKSLAMSIPFVCKSWYDASLHPRCWKSIVFFTKKLCWDDDFVKAAVDRSQRSATSIVFPDWCTVSDETLLRIAERCPALEVLHLPSDSFSYQSSIIPDLIGKLKNLKILKIYDCTDISIILESINNQCKNLYGLDCGSSCVDDEVVLSIVQFTPKIKHLKMKSCYLSRLELITVLKGCRELELLDVSDSIGFYADDVGILNLASHIKSFNCTGSYVEIDYYNDRFDYYVSEDEYFGDSECSFYFDDDYLPYPHQVSV